MTDPEAIIEQLASPYRPVGLSSAYVAVRMPDDTIVQGTGATMGEAAVDARNNWEAIQ